MAETGYFDNITGTMDTTFYVGGAAVGIQKPLSSPITRSVKVSDAEQSPMTTVYTNHEADHYIDGGCSAYTVVTQRNLIGKIVDINVAIDSANPPSVATYSGRFGMARSTNGIFTEGKVYYSDGSNWLLVPLYTIGSHVTTNVAVDFANKNDLESGCLYAWNTITAQWEIRGRASSSTGVRLIKILSIGTSNKASSATLASGDVIMRVTCKIGTEYSAGATIDIKTGGSGGTTVMSSGAGQITPILAHTYNLSTLQAAASGSIYVTIGGSPGQGACEVYVECATGEI